MLKNMYNCEPCGANYNNQKERDACFNSHVLPDSTIAKPIYEPNESYPHTVAIVFGGLAVMYYRDGPE